MTEPSDVQERKGARPARDTRPSLIQLAYLILRGEISEQQALRILRSEGEDEDEEVQTSDA